MTIAIVVRVAPKPADRHHFLELARDNAAASVQESGCRRFDVVDVRDGGDVYLYEIYDDDAAFDFHLASPHFHSFDRATRALILAKQIIVGTLYQNGRTPPDE